MATTERPAKRARQACDPCRRKKSRCPGEKPVCSYCARLNQQCTYSDEGFGMRHSSIADRAASNAPSAIDQPMASQVSENSNNSITDQRLNQLEARLSEVLVALKTTVPYEQPLSSPLPQPVNTSGASLTSTAHVSSDIPSRETLDYIVGLYLKYCHCQPLPLFSPNALSNSLSSHAKEVIFIVSAAALRFSTEATYPQEDEDAIRTYIEKARLLAIERINTGLVELSTLQTLCILSWLDFYAGNTHRAGMYSALVWDLCKSSGLASNLSNDDPVQDEKLRCFWSVVLLQRLHPNIAGPFHIGFDPENSLLYPKSPSRPILSDPLTGLVVDTRSDFKDLGIVAYAIQMTEIWYKVAHYAHRRASAGQYPPWSPNSDYAKIIAHQMNNETTMPYSKHRFKPAKFEERNSEELFQHRDYWGPWLFTQMLYHTIMCVLNHPLLLSLRLRNFRVASIPEIWLQHTDDLISQHSQWMIHLLNLVEGKDFLVSDPFLAHCVAIVATIYLQQSFADDDDVQQQKKANFAKCLRFCQNMGERWPLIKQIAQKLQDFERLVSSSYLNSAASQANDRIFIDLSLFWEILESASGSGKPDTHGLTFGPSLRAKSQAPIAAEELSARLLPEPSRMGAAGSPANGAFTQHTPNLTSNSVFTTSGQPYPVSDDFNVLAQSYFAQGQDFVGNMDDWWLMNDST